MINKETIKLDEVFETKDVTEAAIEKLKFQFPDKYKYVIVKVPVKNVTTISATSFHMPYQ